MSCFCLISSMVTLFIGSVVERLELTFPTSRRFLFPPSPSPLSSLHQSLSPPSLSPSLFSLSFYLTERNDFKSKNKKCIGRKKVIKVNTIQFFCEKNLHIKINQLKRKRQRKHSVLCPQINNRSQPCCPVMFFCCSSYQHSASNQ